MTTDIIAQLVLYVYNNRLFFKYYYIVNTYYIMLYRPKSHTIL